MKWIDVPPLVPLQFFRLHFDIRYGFDLSRISRFFLPDTTSLLGETRFADVGMIWNEKEIKVHLKMNKKFQECVYPKYEEGDAIELFFDTKDCKESGFPTRFCHHFLILPQEIQGLQVIELSRFRNEDSHPLCDPSQIKVHTEIKRDSFHVEISFPSEVLHGYDPLTYSKLGFTYSIHRPKGPSQNFSASSHLGLISQHPSLWATCHLKK